MKPRALPQASVSSSSVLEAYARIRTELEPTPLRSSRVLSLQTGARVLLKLENLQFTGSFKERGALNRLLLLTEAERKRGVVAASAGNHAQALAYHASRLGIASTLVMPQTTPFSKVANTEMLGATIVLHGDSVDAAAKHAARLGQERGLVLVHPFDDASVIAGQGTVALECIEACQDIETIVVPVGGGGLLAGVAVALRAAVPTVRIVGVQSEQYSPAYRAFHAARGVEVQVPEGDSQRRNWLGVDTLADGIAVKHPGRLTLPIIESMVDDLLVVAEQSVERSVNALLELEKTVAEGAGAASLAALFSYPEQFRGQRVVCLISGGNIDPMRLADVIMRGMVRTGRLSQVQLEVRDLPGSLADITRVVAEAGANIVDVRHERVFLASSARIRLQLELATRDRSHTERVVEALGNVSASARVLSSPEG